MTHYAAVAALKIMAAVCFHLTVTVRPAREILQEQRLQADVAFSGEEVCVWVDGEHSDIPIVLQAPQGSDSAANGSGGGGGSIVAPMPGKIVRVLVSEGDTVEEDQPLIVMEAMKMEHTLRASGAAL